MSTYVDDVNGSRVCQCVLVGLLVSACEKVTCTHCVYTVVKLSDNNVIGD